MLRSASGWSFKMIINESRPFPHNNKVSPKPLVRATNGTFCGWCGADSPCLWKKEEGLRPKAQQQQQQQVPVSFLPPNRWDTNHSIHSRISKHPPYSWAVVLVILHCRQSSVTETRWSYTEHVSPTIHGGVEAAIARTNKSAGNIWFQ